MRFLLACHQFFPEFYTGTEVLTLESGLELRRRGHEVAVLTVKPLAAGDGGPEKPEIIEEVFEGLKVWKLIIPKPKTVIEHLERESYERPLMGMFKRVLDEWKPGIVHVYHLMRLTSAFVEQARQYGIPTYLSLTDFWLICPTYQLIRHNMALCPGQNRYKCYSCLADLYGKGRNGATSKKFRLARDHPRLAAFFQDNGKLQSILAERHNRHRVLMRQFSGVFFASPFMRKIFHDNGLENDREYIIPFPIPESSKKVFDLGLPVRQGPLKVAFIGTLRSTKGPQVLIDACGTLKGRTDIEVSIWGAADDMAFEADLKKRADGIDWIRFRGTFPQAEFPQVLQENHVVVIPSLWYENSPLVALSALAARRVLAVSDVGGLSSMVENGVTGCVFPAGDFRALASLLAELAANRESIRKIAAAITPPHNMGRYVDLVVEKYDL